MDLKTYTNDDLYQLRKDYQVEKDARMVRRIVSQVHASVLSGAKSGSKTYSWNSNTYPFDNFVEYEMRHIVEACKQLQALFPDSTVSRPRPKDILIEWF